MRCSLTAEYHNWESGFTSPCRGINEGHDMTSAIVYHGRVAVGGQAQVCDKLGQACSRGCSSSNSARDIWERVCSARRIKVSSRALSTYICSNSASVATGVSPAKRGVCAGASRESCSPCVVSEATGVSAWGTGGQLWRGHRMSRRRSSGNWGAQRSLTAFRKRQHGGLRARVPRTLPFCSASQIFAFEHGPASRELVEIFEELALAPAHRTQRSL